MERLCYVELKKHVCNLHKWKSEKYGCTLPKLRTKVRKWSFGLSYVLMTKCSFSFGLSFEQVANIFCNDIQRSWNNTYGSGKFSVKIHRSTSSDIAQNWNFGLSLVIMTKCSYIFRTFVPASCKYIFDTLESIIYSGAPKFWKISFLCKMTASSRNVDGSQF